MSTWKELSGGTNPPGPMLAFRRPPSDPADYRVWRRVPVKVTRDGAEYEVIARWVGVPDPYARTGQPRMVARVGGLAFDFGDPAEAGLVVEVDGPRWRFIHPVYGPAGWTDPGHQLMPPAWAELSNRARLELAQAREAEVERRNAELYAQDADRRAYSDKLAAEREQRWAELVAARPWLVHLLEGGDARKVIEAICLAGGPAPYSWSRRWRLGGVVAYVRRARLILHTLVCGGKWEGRVGNCEAVGSPEWWAWRTVTGEAVVMSPEAVFQAQERIRREIERRTGRPAQLPFNGPELPPDWRPR